MTNPIKSQIAANRETFKSKLFNIVAKLDNGSHSSNQLQGIDEAVTELHDTSQTSLLQTAIAAVEGLKLTQKIALPEELKIAIRSGDWSKVQWWVEHSLLDEHNFGISKVVELLKGGDRNNMINTVIHGDCLQVMKSIPDKSIDMVLTSPPYDNLRTYNGYTFNFEKIAKELYRVVKDSGVVVWIVGDATIKGSETGTSFRQALYFMKLGFNLHDTMIYQKTYYAPKTHRRYEQVFEYMFVFSKGVPKTFNGILKENVSKSKISGGHHTQPDGTKKLMSAGRKTHSLVTNIRVYNPEKNSTHVAPFPEQLAEDHILSWSNEGDTVLDPMAGSGTTLKMAKKNGRNYIGIEISKEYIDIINERIKNSIGWV